MRMFMALLGAVLSCSVAPMALAEQATFQMVNEMESSDFTAINRASDRAFDQFLFSTLGDCQNIKNKTAFFRAVTNINHPAYATNGVGKELYTFLRLNLLPDRTFYAEYSEDVFVSRSGSVTEIKSVYYTQINGGWRIVGDRLVIDHLGELSILAKTSEYPTAQFQFTSVIHDSRVLGFKLLMGPSSTDVGPHGETVNEFCSAANR